MLESGPYTAWLSQVAALLGQTSAPPYRGLAHLPSHAHPTLPAEAPVVLLCSPHPDDECISGALPLRLLQEAGYRVINFAMTLGSDIPRRAARQQELTEACTYLGFDLRVLLETGAHPLNLAARAAQPAHWQHCVAALVTVLQQTQPAWIISPHAGDGHATHIGTHALVQEALRVWGQPVKWAQSEFWGELPHPNLLVGVSVPLADQLITALACHVGEVRRHPYQLRLPAWLANNARRGSELVNGPGQQAAPDVFATLYTYGLWDGQAFTPSAPMALAASLDDLGPFARG